MSEMKCSCCGGNARLEFLAQDKQSRDARRYIVRCTKCAARTVDAPTKTEAISKWDNKEFTLETIITSRKLTADDMDTTAAVKLSAAVIETASEDYRIRWQEFLQAKDALGAMQEEHPYCKDLDETFEEAKSAFLKAKSKQPNYGELKRNKEQLEKKVDASKRQYPDYWKAKSEYLYLQQAHRSLELFLRTTELLDPVGVSRESLVRSLRIQAEQEETDVTVKVRQGINYGPEVSMVFRNNCWSGFVTDSKYVRIVLNEVDGEKSLVVSSAPAKDGHQTLRAYINGNTMEIRTKRQDIMDWANHRTTQNCKIVFDHFHKRYLIK